MPTTYTAQDVKDFAPEMQNEADSRIDLFLEYSQNFVSEAKWGRKYKMGIICMCCHLLKMSGAERSGNAGAVTSESVGELSRSYSAPPNDNELLQTSYGQTFVALRKTLVITPLCV